MINDKLLTQNPVAGQNFFGCILAFFFLSLIVLRQDRETTYRHGELACGNGEGEREKEGGKKQCVN